jgi:hypothetical protein
MPPRKPQPPELVTMFAVPFGVTSYPGHEELNARLKTLIVDLEARDAANPRPLTPRNAALFESDFNFFRVDHEAVRELKAFCWDQLLSLIGRLNSYDLPTLQKLQIFNSCWFHVTRPGGFFGVHNHPNASWSGVYCVDPGRSDPNKPENGLLSFINPNALTAMYMDPGVFNMRLPFGHQGPRLRLEPGQLVLFPSWVLHHVTPFEGEGERITVAFNCWFKFPETGGSSQPTVGAV